MEASRSFDSSSRITLQKIWEEMKEFTAKQRNGPKYNFLKLPEGGQNVIFAKNSEKGNERLSLVGLNGNYQKLRGHEKEGQNEKTESGGVKVQKLKISAMASDQAMHGRQQAIWSTGIARARDR